MVLVNLITNLSAGGSLTAKSMLTPQMVGVVGLEPTRPEGHQLLRLARLPIPPHADLVEKTSLELATSCLQGRRSPN